MAPSVFGALKLTTQKGSEGGPGAPLSRFLNGQSVEPLVHLRALFGERAANALVAAKRVHDRRDVIRVSIRAHKDMRSEWG